MNIIQKFKEWRKRRATERERAEYEWLKAHAIRLEVGHPVTFADNGKVYVDGKLYNGKGYKDGKEIEVIE